MTNIMRAVHLRIDRDSVLRQHMSQGIVNVRALAKKMLKDFKDASEINPKPSIDAVISAIRRYELKDDSNPIDKAIKAIQDSKISTKTDVVIITLSKEDKMQDYLPKIFSQISFSKGELLRIMQGAERTKIIVDKKNLKKILSVIPESLIIDTPQNAAEINIRLSKSALKVPGVITILSSELAMNKINVLEVVSCLPEFIWFVDQKDLLEAHRLLFSLCHNNYDSSP